MRLIPIEATPNQIVSFVADGAFYTIDLASRNISVMATISKDGKKLIDGVRVVAGSSIIQSQYLMPKDCGFFISTLNGDIVDWQQFGNTQFLYYYDAQDLADVGR